MRQISARWDNQRAIERIYRGLNITPDWSGWLLKNGQRIGYKTNKGQNLVFNFTEDK